MLLLQLATALATALVYFGDPRFRIPFDVFGLALAACLIAEWIVRTEERRSEEKTRGWLEPARARVDGT